MLTSDPLTTSCGHTVDVSALPSVDVKFAARVARGQLRIEYAEHALLIRTVSGTTVLTALRQSPGPIRVPAGGVHAGGRVGGAITTSASSDEVIEVRLGKIGRVRFGLRPQHQVVVRVGRETNVIH